LRKFRESYMNMKVWKENYLQKCLERENRISSINSKIEEYIKEIEQLESEGIHFKSIERLESQIEELQKAKENIPTVDWIKELVEPLAKELSNQLQLQHKIYGPLGSRLLTWICFVENPQLSIEEQSYKTLLIVPLNLEKAQLGYAGNKAYPEGFVPDIFDYLNDKKEILPIPDEIEEIIPLIR